MKTREQAQLSLESNEIILKAQIAKLKELEKELHSIKYNIDYTQGEISKNKEILDGLSVSEVKEFGQNILDSIFKPELNIRLHTDWDDGDDEESSNIITLEIYQGNGCPTIAYETTYSRPSKGNVKEVIYTMIVEDVIRNLIND